METGSCRSTTHLCQVGTTSRHCAVHVQIPETEVSAEIDQWYTQTPIGWNEPASGTQNKPFQAMGREQVQSALKPVSTATSDQQVG
jgi:hypothetical protein